MDNGKNSAALLVIDVDSRDGWKLDVIRDENKEMASSLMKELAHARCIEIPIIFVMFDHPFDRTTGARRGHPPAQMQADGHCLGCDREENKLAGFLEHRHSSPFESIFVKYTNDAFSNSALAPYLHTIGAKELFLAGCSTSCCVCATARGAVSNGFSVTLLEHCVSPPFDARYSEDVWIESVRAHIRQDSGAKVNVRSVILA